MEVLDFFSYLSGDGGGGLEGTSLDFFDLLFLLRSPSREASDRLWMSTLGSIPASKQLLMYSIRTYGGSNLVKYGKSSISTLMVEIYSLSNTTWSTNSEIMSMFFILFPLKDLPTSM